MSDGFRKSSYSNDGGHCVEVRETHGDADVRDTQNREAATLSFPSAEWRALLMTESRAAR